MSRIDFGNGLCCGIILVIGLLVLWDFLDIRSLFDAVSPFAYEYAMNTFWSIIGFGAVATLFLGGDDYA